MKMSRRSLPACALALGVTFGLVSGIGSDRAAAEQAATPAAAAKPTGYQVPDKFPVPIPDIKVRRPNTMMDPITPEARRKSIQSTLALSPFSAADLINLMAYKIPVKAGVSYEDVVAGMKSRANKINFKFVGVNALYKDVEAISGKPAPKVEVYSFCDAMVARELLDYSLEFVVFLPCRIALVEDADKKLWLVMQDWDVRWLDGAPNPNKLPNTLYQAAVKLRAGMEEIMQAGATGAF